ncbi:MAG: glycine cleavage system protein H [Gemmatimonadota bacterium]|nr:MAG: glycine cleavage system protein H [Gemmatimonadota bacterium]
MNTLLDYMTRTLGIEYLIAVVFIVGFVLYWRFLTGPEQMRVREVIRRIRDVVGGFVLPDHVFYHQGHAWARIDDKNVATIGLDDFAQKLVGKIDAVHMPGVGSPLRQGEKGWSLEVNSRPIDMLSPVDGEILSVNEELINSPETVNTDPYGKGWLMKVRAPRISANVKSLLSGDLAKRWIEEARENLLSRGNYELGLMYQDGGLPVDGMARNLDPERWDTIAKEFFLITEE